MTTTASGLRSLVPDSEEFCMSTVRASREEILAAMRSALEGADAMLTHDSLSKVDWLAFDQNEKSALLQLQNWEQDRPLRSAFPRHAEYSSKRLEHLISILV